MVEANAPGRLVKKNILDSRLYQYLDIVSAFLLLNLAWLVACLPLITVFPATVAMFAVAREWVNKKEFGGTDLDPEPPDVRGLQEHLGRDSHAPGLL